MTQTPYPRMQIRVSRTGRVAVLACEVRRRVHRLLAWDLGAGTVSRGSVFHGSLRLLDVSPDGRWHSFFACGGDAAHPGKAWAAVAEAPSAVAAAVWTTIPPWQVSVWWADDGSLLVSGFKPELHSSRIDPGLAAVCRVCDAESRQLLPPGPPTCVTEAAWSPWRLAYTPVKPCTDWPGPAADVAEGPQGQILATFGAVVRVYSLDSLGALHLRMERDLTHELHDDAWLTPRE